MAVVAGGSEGVQGVLDAEAAAVGEAPGEQQGVDQVVDDAEDGALDDPVLDVGDGEEAGAAGGLGDLHGIDGVRVPGAGAEGEAELV